ncbi:asparagine synthase (glutamine-hydrolyzing) [Methylocystis sp. H62]|uniref:asparagine synthase (glutamine-hydrolyzing) n=1 Tax=Methylocystis sp. H62 TaxID=2785789 RepID=UPI0018C28A1B|nr:asparagine synthase (glutamine-hydrolyzing) [Methylocystis sp. H62]MBG0792645.1 asparagine synthase (glutamine-hydrolyzing) [Methylocystis sp. H62]
MCGISGFLTSGTNPRGLNAIKAMTNALVARGPDGAGYWSDPEGRLFLGHRRLSIIDLSSAGHQPMESASGRFVMTFNGEIYNHAAIRSQLEDVGAAPKWRGHSDTETFLAAIEHWGLDVALKRVTGMFAIALWDIARRTLYLARDRFGEKPLYYGWVGHGGQAAFAFGSELKALRAYPGFANPVSLEALALYLRFMYVPAPYSIYEGVYKLEPGCVLSISGDGPPSLAQPLRPPATHGGATLSRWWSLDALVESGAQHQFESEADAIGALEQSLRDAVKLQSVADVPLGAFLSGGVDSSTIVALMQQQAARPVKTFTVSFEEAGFDEAPHARAVARHLGSDHSELYVTAAEALSVIPNLPVIYDEPFADSSQIPTLLVCHAARQHVTVALSGDAGDELFGGYNRYLWGPRLWSRLSRLPYSGRQALGGALAAVPESVLELLSRPVNAVLPGSRGIGHLGEKAHKLASRLRGAHNFDDFYRNLVSEWQDPSEILSAGCGRIEGPLSLLDDPLPTRGAEPRELQMMYRDSLTYLPDDILCKVDRAAMATSLETRVPFLDQRVAEVAWRLPLHMKIRDGQGKWALRQVLHKYVPRELIERPKAGFSIPVGQWLRGPLRGWAENLLDETRLVHEGYFKPAQIREAWRQHLSGRRDLTPKLWSILMFQAWLRGIS